MPAIQPIPQPTPSSSDKEASALLALHNRSTDGRVRTPARWNPPTRRGNVAGGTAGKRVK